MRHIAQFRWTLLAAPIESRVCAASKAEQHPERSPDDVAEAVLASRASDQKADCATESRTDSDIHDVAALATAERRFVSRDMQLRREGGSLGHLGINRARRRQLQ
jgi:hypothetical protein